MATVGGEFVAGQKPAKRHEEGHDSGLSEFEARGFLTVGGDGRLQEPLQALLTETAVLTGPLDLQPPMVDVPGNRFEVGQVFEILAHSEIEGMVDGAFGATGAAFLEVLLQIEAFVGADLDEALAELGIVEIEIVVFDEDDGIAHGMLRGAAGGRSCLCARLSRSGRPGLEVVG